MNPEKGADDWQSPSLLLLPPAKKKPADNHAKMLSGAILKNTSNYETFL